MRSEFNVLGRTLMQDFDHAVYAERFAGQERAESMDLQVQGHMLVDRDSADHERHLCHSQSLKGTLQPGRLIIVAERRRSRRITSR